MVVDLTNVNTTANYEIVGGLTEPVTPSTNTIWVKTEHPITGHVFSSKEPEEPYDGLVFFKNSANSRSDSFSVYKPYPVIVYGAQAKQYVNNKWVSALARRYHDNSYTDWWDGDLFYTAITGGLVLASHDPSVKLSNHTISINSNTEEAVSGSVDTANYIDLKGWNKLSADLSHNGVTVTCKLGINYLDGTTSVLEAYSTTIFVSDPSTTTKRLTVDLSQIDTINKKYKVRLTVSTTAATVGSASIFISSLTLL